MNGLAIVVPKSWGVEMYCQGWVIIHCLLYHCGPFIIISQHIAASAVSYLWLWDNGREQGECFSPALFSYSGDKQCFIFPQGSLSGDVNSQISQPLQCTESSDTWSLCFLLWLSNPLASLHANEVMVLTPAKTCLPKFWLSGKDTSSFFTLPTYF